MVPHNALIGQSTVQSAHSFAVFRILANATQTGLNMITTPFCHIIKHLGQESNRLPFVQPYCKLDIFSVEYYFHVEFLVSRTVSMVADK